MSGSLLLNIAYGVDAQSTDHPYISIVDDSMKTVKEAMNPGSFLVDSIPIRTFSSELSKSFADITILVKYVPEWVPGARFQTLAKELRKICIDGREIPYQDVKDAMVGRGLYFSP
jgi:hypothetical protein